MKFPGNITSKMKKFNYFFILVIAFGVYITFFSDYNYMRVMEYETRIKQLQSEIKTCNDSTEVYRQRLDKLNSDPETMERIVREDYLMKRDNEDIYIVNE